MRDTTERPEAVEANCARLVGTKVESIYENVTALIDDEAEYSRMANAQNPFGVGNAAALIADYLAEKSLSELKVCVVGLGYIGLPTAWL